MPWNPIDSPRDYIVLAGQISPGHADISGAASTRDLAIRQQPFSTGAAILFKRRELATFTVTIRLYSLQDHIDFSEWRSVVDAIPSERTRAVAIDIWHPLLEQLDIRSCVVKRVGQLVQSGDGSWSVAIDFVESRPLPKPSLAKLEGAKASPVDPIDARIDRNTKAIRDRVARLAAP